MSVESVRRIRSYRKANNLCILCGHPHDRKFGYCCIQCSEKCTKYRRAYSAELRKQGKCVHCRKPVDRKSTICSACAIRSKLQRVAREKAEQEKKQHEETNLS